MEQLHPSLLQRLSRTRLLIRSAQPSIGVGERRSRAKGVGMEFAEHRPYQHGDDVRHIDRHVFARLGEHHIRQYSLYQQLPVTVLIDASGSMRFGQPAKYDLARALGAALAYVALAGGDRVSVGTFSGGQTDWYPALHGIRRSGALFRWLDARMTGALTELPKVARDSAPRLAPGGLLFLVSDLMASELAPALKAFHRAQQEIVVVHVTAPEEEDPQRMGPGQLRLLDSESGHEVEVSLDPELLRRYAEQFALWKRGLREEVLSQDGIFLEVRSDVDLDRLLLRDWRSSGVIA